MEPQCSCSACSSFACPIKRHPLCVYRDRKSDRTFLCYNKIDKNINTFPLDDLQLKQKYKEYGDELDEFVEQEYETLTNTSVASCGTNLKGRQNSPNILGTNQSAAKLSAQVMNVPFKDFESSLRRCDPPLTTNVSKLTPFDIFEKIKEVYRACSCKVCECIVGKPQINEPCSCKPCECDDCNNSKEKGTTENTYRSVDVTQFETNSLKLERGLLKRFARQTLEEECSCKPLDCTKCVKSKPSPWSSEQCRRKAGHSHRYQKLVIAAVESDNETHLDCICNPCNCAECSHRYGLSSNLRHEMSTEINRPEGCHCEACLNEACLPEGANTCSCERRDRVMRKPVQRDTNYGIHRSIITRRNTCTQDLIAMFAATSKIYPDCHSQARKCNCNQCECFYCDYKDDSAKTSRIVISKNNRSMHGTVKYKSSPLAFDHDFVPRKTSSQMTKATSCITNLERPSDIKAISKFSSNCRCNPSEFVNSDNIITCKGDVCDCTQCKCEQCVSKDEFIYPIKKGEKLTPAIFENKINKSFMTFCDEKNQNDDNYKTTLNQMVLSTQEEHHKINLKKKYVADVCDDHSHGNNPNIEYRQKASTKAKNFRSVEPLIDFSNIKRTFDRNEVVTFQASNSKMIPDYSVSNYMGSESVPSDNNYQTKKCKTSTLSDVAYCNKFTSVNNNNNILPKINTEYLNNSNVNNRYAKDMFGINTVSSRPNKDSEKSRRNVIHDKYFVENNNIDSVNENNQCVIIGRNNSSDKPGVTQAVEKNIVPFSRMKEISAEDFKRSVHYSKSVEKGHNEGDSENTKHIASTEINHFDLDEDYRRVKKTIKDARAFSLHLMKLLEKYEKANSEFESVYRKFTRSNKNNMVRIPQKNSHQVNEDFIVENYSKKHTTNNLFDNEPTKESNTIQNQRIGNDNRLNTNVKTIQSSNLLTDVICNNRSITEFIQDSSKDIVDVVSENVDGKNTYTEPKNKHVSSESICNSSYNDDAIIDFKHDSSHTSSLNDSDVIDDFINYEVKIPIIEANKTTSVPSQVGHNMKKKLKLYKPAVTVSKRKQLNAPAFAECSITPKTLDELGNQIDENDKDCNQVTLVDESNLLDTVSTGDSDTIMNAQTEHISSEIRSKIRNQDIAEHRAVVMIKSPFMTERPNAKQTKNDNNCRATGSEVPVSRKQSLEKNLKEAVNKLKQASMTWESDYAKTQGRHENIALIRLHAEVKKLLEMPLLQKCEIQNDVQRAKTLEANNVHKRESLKVGYLTVHKLSDSTIAVKWQVPKVLENVQGYEVLVNGQVVQKIQDNMCNESMVLTGLPRSDKILVTVRTVTLRPSSSCHGRSPTATVVYRPRASTCF